MEDDDFTFPTVAEAPAAAPLPAQPEGQLGSPPVPRLLHHQLPVPDLAAASPLWPFAGSPKAAAPPPPCTPVATKDDEEAGPPVPASAAGRAEAEAAEEEEARRAAAAADEERMDLLWDVTASPSPATRSAGSAAGGHAEPPPAPKQERRGEADDNDKRRAAAVADAERMDKLWESFNEDLLLLRRHARSKSAAAHPGEGKDTWYLCSSYPASDAESSEETAASSSASPAEGRRGYGCAPTMLRASSRAGGGAAQFCGSSSPSRRRGSGRRGGWALLLRLFRRLFSVDKAPAASRSHATSIYVP